jgi:hypothetical protein
LAGGSDSISSMLMLAALAPPPPPPPLRLGTAVGVQGPASDSSSAFLRRNRKGGVLAKGDARLAHGSVRICQSRAPQHPRAQVVAGIHPPPPAQASVAALREPRAEGGRRQAPKKRTEFIQLIHLLVIVQHA